MIGVYKILKQISDFFSRDEPDVTSNMQDRPACNIICVAIHNKLPAGHILLPTTWRGRGSPRASIIVRISPLIAMQIWSA